MDAVGFITAIRVLFPVHHESKQHATAWIESYARQLRGFDSKILEIASADIIQKRGLKEKDRRSFPTVAECLAACKEAKRLVDTKKQGQLPTLKAISDQDGLYSEARKALVWRECMPSAMAKQAAREGWIGMLESYCYQHGRLPEDKNVIAKLKQDAIDIDNWHDSSIPAMVKAKIKILQKRQELADRVLSGWQP